MPETNRSREGEIPDILEWKLDVIMAHLAKIGGGKPEEHNPKVGGTRVRLPDPDTFDPKVDPIPNYPGIPRILEWKLDVIMRALGRLAGGPGIAPGIKLNLDPIPLLLLLILFAIMALQGPLCE